MTQQVATTCGRCGTENPVGSRFCRACGDPAGMTQPAPAPDSPSCWYCDRRPAEQRSVAEVLMYADAKRSFAGLTGSGYRTRIEWRSGTVSVPRCPTCMGGHKAAYRWERAGLWAGILLGGPIFLLLVAASSGSGLGMLAGMVAGVPGSFLWAWQLGKWIGERRAAGAGTRPYKPRSRAHPAVALQLTQGWRLGKPRGVR